VSEAATFLASFPAIQSAIKVYGDRQGMRVQLDIPESEMGEAIKLLMWRERVLVVTIGPESEANRENRGHDSDRAVSRTKAKRRV